MVHEQVSSRFSYQGSPRSRTYLIAVVILTALGLVGPKILVAEDPCLDPPYHGDSIFDDVPPWAAEYVARATDMGIIYGCDGTHFCSTDAVLRSELAVFLELAVHGAIFAPAPAEGIFEDVPSENEYACWVEGLVGDEITTGCHTDPLEYCPENSVNRAQMAAFLIRLIKGPNYMPPPCTGVFADVNCGGFWAADYIEDIYARGITTGCSGSSLDPPFLFCPLKDVNRAQMATFLDRSVRYSEHGECLTSLSPPTNISGN